MAITENADDALEALRELEFKRGYLIACCNLVNLHHDTVVANDVLQQCGISENDVSRMNLTEYDAVALAEIREGRSFDPITGPGNGGDA
ncbi:hypothetical protein [Martelella mangrovi]|uniref:Uncharacterized protein n=1 Tax=Martelella mangrovi TaxID=1397477 RepID=A0ABV2IIK6_9HYPH